MILLPLGMDNDCRGSFISLLKSVYETLVCACVCAKPLSLVQLFVTPYSVTHQSPLSMEFSRKGYWSWLPCPSPGDLPDPGKGTNIKLFELRQLLHWQADSLPTEPPGKPTFQSHLE